MAHRLHCYRMAHKKTKIRYYLSPNHPQSGIKLSVYCLTAKLQKAKSNRRQVHVAFFISSLEKQQSPFPGETRSKARRENKPLNPARLVTLAFIFSSLSFNRRGHQPKGPWRGAWGESQAEVAFTVFPGQSRR